MQSTPRWCTKRTDFGIVFPSGVHQSLKVSSKMIHKGWWCAPDVPPAKGLATNLTCSLKPPNFVQTVHLISAESFTSMNLHPIVPRSSSGGQPRLSFTRKTCRNLGEYLIQQTTSEPGSLRQFEHSEPINLELANLSRISARPGWMHEVLPMQWPKARANNWL